jgi:monoamine oxidase
MSLLASASTQVDVAVVGAGVAGLAATRALRAGGLSVALLEAGQRIGGRAFTDYPAPLGGQPFDHGAQWLHAAHRNPLVDVARQAGEKVAPDAPWEHRVRMVEAPGRPVDPAAYAQAEADWTHLVTTRLGAPDCSLAEAGDPMASNPYLATIEAWEGAIIAAADADALSLADWHANALDGENHVSQGGLGALLARLLATDATLGARVAGIAAEAGGVVVRTQRGTLRAGAAIVTVATGVLRAETIRFTPALPQPVLAALDGLPMGLLSKVALPAAGEDRLGLPEGAGVFRRLGERGAAFASTLFWPQGQAYAVGYVGGRAAWALADRPAEAGAFIRDDIAASLGPDALAAFAPGQVTTAWATHQDFRGAYAYARPGHAGARAALGEPLWDGRLAFAGEACAPDGFAGTVAGAYRAGLIAAARMIDGFTRRATCL